MNPAPRRPRSFGEAFADLLKNPTVTQEDKRVLADGFHQLHKPQHPPRLQSVGNLERIIH